MTKDQFVAAITGFTNPGPFSYYPQSVGGKTCYINQDGSMVAFIGSNCMWYQGTRTLALGNFQVVYDAMINSGRYS